MDDYEEEWAALQEVNKECMSHFPVDWQAVAREERARADKVERECDEAAACAWKGVVHLLADGELRDAEAEGARAHAAGCATCGRDIEDAVQLGVLARTVAPVAPLPDAVAALAEEDAA